MEPEEPQPQHFERARAGFVKLTSDALLSMQGFMQLSANATEAGGVLIGRYIIDSNDVVIDRVTGPMPGDRRTRFTFHRAHERHQHVLDQEWSRSGGRRVYLGEWHTHPEPVPTPSGTDRRDWKRRLLRDSFEAEFLLFVIVGQEETRIWEGDRASLSIYPLRRRLDTA